MQAAGPEDASATDRLVALRGYGILDTPNEPEFDRIVRNAANMFHVPIALISFLDEHRSWFKARVGLDSRETPSTISFCTHAVQGGEVFVVEDATKDARFAASPLVTGAPFIRFYAGVPLTTPTGRRIGSLCIIDTSPRSALSVESKEAMTEMAAEVMQQVEARRLRMASEAEHAVMRPVGTPTVRHG